jgi:diketogulonate reductase-like aldo/keto reductase
VWLLPQGAVLLGVRLGLSDHTTETKQVFEVALDEEDMARIQAVTDKGRSLMQAIGDCGSEYRG